MENLLSLVRKDVSVEDPPLLDPILRQELQARNTTHECTISFWINLPTTSSQTETSPLGDGDIIALQVDLDSKLIQELLVWTTAQLPDFIHDMIVAHVRKDGVSLNTQLNAMKNNS